MQRNRDGDVGAGRDGGAIEASRRDSMSLAVLLVGDLSQAIERVEDGVAFVELWANIEKQLKLPS